MCSGRLEKSISVVMLIKPDPQSRINWGLQAECLVASWEQAKATARLRGKETGLWHVG